MDAHLLDRLHVESTRLTEYASTQPGSGGELDFALALGLALEALRVLAEDVNELKSRALELSPGS